MKKYILIILTLQAFCLYAMAQEKLKGRVVDAENQQPLAGAVIKIKTPVKTVISNNEGYFELNLPKGTYELQVQYLAYDNKELLLQLPQNEPLLVRLHANENKLQEVQVVSTGYQTLPKERATGSFVLVDSALLNQRATTNILDRLDGVVAGLNFNRNLSGLANNAAIAIRGRSTIFGNPNPLIILDNFPYDGDLENINPNDIENVSILKDAAAASIWGVRAGNGVIVITTKKGKAGQVPSVSLTTNLSYQQRPDVFAQPWLSSAEYIDLEQYLYTKGYYNSALRNQYAPISPVVQLLANTAAGQISSTAAQVLINQLKGVDVREQWDRYFYQDEWKQQHQLSVAGGSDKQRYYLAGGADQNRGNRVNEHFSRLTLNANNTYYLLKGKLELFTGIGFTQSNTLSATENYSPFTPYDLLANEPGEAMELGRYLRPSYTDTVGGGRLLDWKYRPLDERNQNRQSKLLDYRLNLRLGYQIMPGLKLSLNYQYQRGLSNSESHNAEQSYYTRNMINTYSTINPLTGLVSSPIATGAIVALGNQNYQSQHGRAQLDFLKQLGHGELSLLAGAEIKDYSSTQQNQTYFGYDEATGVNGNALISANTLYTNFYSGARETIVTSPRQSALYDRFLSYFAQGSYRYLNRYVLSASVRRDESNLFGVKANQQGVPLWSVGARYEISKAPFYQLSWLPMLAIKASYGYNGNVDKSTSAYLTSSPFTLNPWGYTYAQIINPPNPSLRWERVQHVNMGVDFASKDNFFSGSIEYFVKQGQDLIGQSPIVPQTGITLFRGNAASTKANGIDMTTNFNWMKNSSSWQWRTSILFGYSREKVTDYSMAPRSNADIVSGNYDSPLVGYPYNAIFSFRYQGLDGNGNPVGYLAGAPSTDYAKITASYLADELIFHGSATPQVFGALRNQLSFKGLTLTVNLSYKFDYYVRRQSVFNGNNYGFNSFGFGQRWQAPGDEQLTNIPSLVYPANAARGTLANYGQHLVERADHIRLQYLQLHYPLKVKGWFGGGSSSVYFNMSNLGTVWKLTKHNYDPEFNYGRAPLLATLGVKLNLN